MLFPTEKFFEKEKKAFLARLLHKVFLDDWLMKLIALVITLGLWLGVTGLRTPTSRRLSGVPLSLRVANDLEVTNSPVTEVDIKISGDKSKIDQINQRDLTVTVDLTDVQAGDRTVQITPDNVSIELPAGFKLEEIQPTRIAVKLERIIERDVRVKAETEGAVAEDSEIYNIAIAPQMVRVRGPESFVKPIDSISTEKVDVEGHREDFTAQQVALNIISPKVRLIDTTVVDVSFRIGEKRIEKPYLIPVKTEKGIKTATVVLYGAQSLFVNLPSENLKVEVLKNEAGENSLRLVLPADIQNKVEIRKLKIN